MLDFHLMVEAGAAAGHAAAEGGSPLAMWASVGIFALAYVFIATEKVDKTIAALLGAGAVIILHLVPYQEALHTVDLNVIFLLTGMMIIMNIMSQTGVFEWLAVVIAKWAKGNGTLILLMFMFATAIISAFLDNVTTVILIAPITILICEILEIKAIPFLVLEAIASNIGGTATLIGDPPNVIIGSQSHLTFNEFIFHLTPPVVFMMLVLFPPIAYLFRNVTRVSDMAKARIMKATPALAITDPDLLKRSMAVFGVVLFGFFVGHPFGVEPGITALAGAMLMTVICQRDVHHVLEKVEWNSVFFFVGLFMMIGALEHNQVFEKLGTEIVRLTQGNYLLTIMAVLWIAALASAVVDNIPLVIAMIPLIETIVPEFSQSMGLTDEAQIKLYVHDPLLWALALGACLGGNGTLVGASANVIVTQIARRNNYPLTFATFTAYGFPIMIITTIIATGFVYLRYFIMLGR
jgi:Na+/H+ antiporter NhaD/arsenite permease-like protein